VGEMTDVKIKTKYKKMCEENLMFEKKMIAEHMDRLKSIILPIMIRKNTIISDMMEEILDNPSLLTEEKINNSAIMIHGGGDMTNDIKYAKNILSQLVENASQYKTNTKIKDSMMVELCGDHVMEFDYKKEIESFT
jgi:hypothetical protein